MEEYVRSVSESNVWGVDILIFVTLGTQDKSFERLLELLEKEINIRASDYKFIDKKKFYIGYTNARNQYKEGTKIKELRDLAKFDDFTEKDIEERNKKMIDFFINL